MQKIITLICFMIILQISKAQTFDSEIISSGGGNYLSTNVELEWVVGEIVTEEFENSEVGLSQGFVQTNVEVTTSIEELDVYKVNINLYPNPTIDKVTVETNDELLEGKINCILYNELGEKVLQNQILSNTTSIDISILPEGAYIYVITGNKVLKTGKIIKK